ncbi:nickel-dependent hydrogenase large subunit [Raineyella sp. LH-20]|uniref:nickel-dependent hydrogenase large subunit n=1 Tax=Raineyella sp. LH-20 TaxID=3081204 RepID=UPI0029544EC0|nr:nickel-dependent hydrogenase large subunit [Raineyella sp. LH-20]WOP18682.1 nickel-dependent hydrogenase large subunit [Raineyella sp. LH-20]
MAQRVVIDPLTRIEGHLRIELETGSKKIEKAWSETTQFRGIETIIAGRDPRDAWAFAQRICGVCTSVHAVASIVAVENAIGSNPPEQARLIRDMVMASQNIQDHVIHFYHLHALDWVNVPSAATADPQKAVDFAKAIGSTWKGNTLARMTEVRDTVKGILASGQLSIFTGGYWDHPDYRLPPEANLMAVAHYLDALEFQRSMIRIATVFGGKNPHPNFLVGGMACTIDPSHSESINEVQLDQIKQWIAESSEFVSACYVPDAMAIMGVYKDYFDIGAAQPNYLAVGMAGATYAGDPASSRLTSPYNEVKPGAIYDGDLGTVHPFDPTKIAEWVSSAWYTYEEGDIGLTPDKGETSPHYTGPKPPYEWLADGKEYTWSKAPRYDGRVVQVGPVARVILGYAQGHPATKKLVDDACKKLGIRVAQLNSTAGRTLARALECALIADILSQNTFPTFVKNIVGGDIDVFDASRWEPSSWPGQSSGFSLVEVPRGFLSHWVTIEKGKVARYQAVVPTTWLGGGRDADGKQGPYEESLAGNGKHPLVDPAQPLEPLRTIHSFDPCMSCAVHVLDPDGSDLAVVAS